ncbi:MAG: MmgE/PrpD family protein [Pseudomonadota bacterium]
MNMQSKVESQPITTALAEFALGLAHDDVPAEVRTRAHHTMLDAAGIALASTRYPFAHPVLAGLQAFDDIGTVPVFGMAARLSARDAATMNGFLCHGLDYDDTHIAGIVHATASLLPACLSAASMAGSSGREVITAYVVGIETATRLGMCARGAFHQAGFHPTGMIGIFGCVLAAGRLMGLNAKQLENAQGIAVSMASGSMEFLEDGASNKRFHPGWAASSALTACALAREGFKGATRPYDGRFGLYNIYGGKFADWFDFSGVAAEFGTRWELMNVAIKPYPTCHFTHASIDCALALRDRAPIDKIARIDASVPQEVHKTICEPVANKRRPQNDYDAKFSTHFLVGTALKYGRLGLAELEPEFLADADVARLMELTECHPYGDGPFPAAYSGKVKITLTDGTVLEQDEPVNRGAADRPLSNAEIVAKYRENAAMWAGPDRVDAMQAAMLSLDDAPDAASALAVFSAAL